MSIIQHLQRDVELEKIRQQRKFAQKFVKIYADRSVVEIPKEERWKGFDLGFKNAENIKEKKAQFERTGFYY